MEYGQNALPEKGVPAAVIGAFSHIGLRSIHGKHRLCLKETGDCPAAFMNPKGAFRTAPAMDRALKWAWINLRKDVPGQDILQD